MTRIPLAVATALVALAVAPPALAQVVIEESGGAGSAFSKTEWPTQSLPRQPLTLAPGLIELGIPARIDISKTNPGVPDWSIPAYLRFGVADSFEVGVFHDVGLCLAGKSGGCAEVYDDVGGNVRVGLARFGTASQLALDLRVLASGFSSDSTAWVGSAGLLYKLTLGNLAFLADVDWASRFNKRDQFTFADQIAAHLGAQLELVPGLSAYGRIGWEIPVNKTTLENVQTATVQGPVTVGAEIVPVKPIGLGAALTFRNLVGDGASADSREIVAYARIFL